MASPQITLPPEMYATISGVLDQAATQRILAGFSAASQQAVLKIHIMFQSSGGAVGEGVCLYNFLRNLPIDLTIYNMGLVASVGVIAYLGAPKRKVNRSSHFMLHRTQTTAQSATTQALKAYVQSAVLFDKTTEAILRENIDMPAEMWTHFDHHDLWLSADDAVKFGIADEVADFAPPFGTTVYAL
jgi:ATP-dependent Clp protease protease subunit